MKIYINNISINASVYDDLNFVISRYSIKKRDTIPMYLRIVEQDVTIKENIKLTVIDAREEFNHISLSDLITNEVFSEINYLYPYLEKKDIAIFLLLKKYKTTKKEIKEDLKILKKIDIATFFSEVETFKILEEYPLYIKNIIEGIEEKIKERNNIDLTLDKTEPIPLKEFDLEELTVLYEVQVQNGISLEDIFDAIDVSYNIPFIYLIRNGKEERKNKQWYKIHERFDPSIEEIRPDRVGTSDCIYFKILIVGEDNQYFDSEAVWYENNNIEIDYSLDNEIKEISVKNIFFDSIEDRINYKIIREKQVGVKGTFIVENISFNRAILSDMISNSDLFSYFLFFNENPADTKSNYKTVLTKKRFMFYYEPDQDGPSPNSLSVVITPQLSENGDYSWIDVRVRKALGKDQIESFQYIFSRLLNIYFDNCKSIISEYALILPEARVLFNKFSKKVKKVSSKDDKKSGKRLIELKNKRPGVFRAGYASMCQPKRFQPYLLDDKDVEKFKNKYGDNKVMEFEDPKTGKKDWYACEPREPGEANTHIYPGLRKNTKGNLKYKKEVPFIPCCFGEDQYKKPASELRRRVIESQNEQSSEKMENMEEIGHILSSSKNVPPGRIGSIPFYLANIAKKSGYNEIEKGTQITLPIFRYGVIQKLDSFLHCMEKAFNPEYSLVNTAKKIQIVRGVRERLATMNFAIAKQELFDHTDQDIRNILLDDRQYIDPSFFISLVELKYNCNIFIYQLSDDDPDGSVVIPRFSQSYLPKKISPDKRTVFIIKKSLETSKNFQCEILVKYSKNNKKNDKFTFIFENDVIINRAIKTFYESNNVSFITPNSFSFCAPFMFSEKLSEEIVSQYIDSMGKGRMVVYKNGICLMTSPFPPLNKPETQEIKEVSIKKAIKFIKSKGLVITMQDGDDFDKEIQGIWVKEKKSKNTGIFYGYIPVNIGEALKKSDIDEELIFFQERKDDYINFSPVFLNDPLRIDNESELQKYRKLSKIAEFLKQYTLFHYSLNPEKFGKDSFVIDTNHNYDINILDKRLIPNNNVMYKEGKLVVPSTKVRNNLINFLRVELTNNHSDVISYSNREIIKNYYTSLSDFRKIPGQFIFVDERSLLMWKYDNEQKFRRNVINSFTNPGSEPYFYRNYNIEKGRLSLIQNVKNGSLERALGIGEMWEINRINFGYEYNKLLDPSKTNYVLYTEEGRKKSFEKNKLRKSPTINVIKYYNGNYAAFLFL